MHTPSTKYDLSIIIVSYNTAALTLQTLQSAVAACQQPTPLRAEIIVVDNNSTDNSTEVIAAFCKTSPLPAQLIKNSTNDGFAKANNQGIKQASGHYLLLLNSDTIVQPNAFHHLLAAFKNHPDNDTTADLSSQHATIDRLGIVAATLNNPDGSPQPQGGSFPTLWSLANHLLMLDDLPMLGKLLPSTQHTGRRSQQASAQHSHTAPLIRKDWVGGTAMMIRREVIEEIGLLDEDIFMYGEDVEYCLRATNHHWDIAEVPNAHITHFGSASGSSANALIGELKGYLYIWAKHKPSWQYPVAKLLIQLGCRLRIILFGTIRKQPAKVSAYKEALRKIAAL